MRKIIFLSAMIAVLGSATLTQARDYRVSCSAAPADQWLSASDLAAKFVAQGYTVRKIELKQGCGEANLIDSKGLRTEVRFDPANGTIMTRSDRDSRRYHRDDGDRHHRGDGRHDRDGDDRR
jgi:hypothetical protein